jgi:hypothetical protein
MQLLYQEMSDTALSEQLKIHRQNYEILSGQVARFTVLHAPVHQLTGLDDEQSSLKAIRAEFQRRGLDIPPPERLPTGGQPDTQPAGARGETERAEPDGPLLQPSQNIRADLLLTRALVRRGDNPQRAWSTLQSILLADSAQGQAWRLISELLDDPAQRAEALERAARHGHGETKKRDRSGAIMWGLLSLIMLMLGAVIVISWLEAIQRGRLSGGMSVTASTALLVFACMVCYFLANFQEDWTRERRTAERAQRRGYLFMGVGILGMMLFILISLFAIYRQSILGLPIADSWITNLIIVGGMTSVLAVTAGPLAMVELMPALLLSRGLARVFNAGVVLLGLMLVGLAPIGRNTLPWWMLVGATIVGLSLIGITIFAYRRGDSLFDAMLDITGSNIQHNKLPR